MASGNFIPWFHVAQGNLYYTTSAPTYSGSAAISANAFITTSTQVISMKNITFTPPRSDREPVNLLGEESTSVGAGVPATGSFQNQIFDDKSWSEATLTGTLIFTAHNDGSAPHLPDFIDLVTGTGQAISTTYHRHTFGDSTTGQTGILVGAIALVMKNGVQEATLLMNAPRVNLGDIKPTGDDGHYEIDIEAKCLCKDAVIEIADQDT